MRVHRVKSKNKQTKKKFQPKCNPTRPYRSFPGFLTKSDMFTHLDMFIIQKNHLRIKIMKKKLSIRRSRCSAKFKIQWAKFEAKLFPI